MRTASLSELLPSGVVKNTSLPGASLAPGVPSICPLIEAELLNDPLPSAPVNCIRPRSSSSDMIVFEFKEVPLHLPKVR